MHATFGSLRSKLSLYLLYHDINESAELDDGTDKAYNHETCAHWMEARSGFMSEEPRAPPPKFQQISSDLQIWLGDHRRAMKVIIKAHHDSTDAFINAHGTAICANNLHELWEAVAASPDTDSAKQLIQATRFLAKELAATCNGSTTKNLEAYLQLVEKLMDDLGLEQEEDNQDNNVEE